MLDERELWMVEVEVDGMILRELVRVERMPFAEKIAIAAVVDALSETLSCMRDPKPAYVATATRLDDYPYLDTTKDGSGVRFLKYDEESDSFTGIPRDEA